MQTRSKEAKTRDVDIMYSPDPTTTTRTKTRKKHRKNTAEMKKQPEHVYFDYKYENLDGSGILALEGEPTNAKFYTERPVLWKNALLKHHMSLYQQDKHSRMPRFRPSENGDQLLVKGNYSDNTEEFLVTVFVYKTGVVLVQGRDFVQWIETDFKNVRALVEEDQHAVDRSLNESRQRQRKTSPKMTPMMSATKTKNPAPGPMISTPAYTDKNATPPDLLFSADDSASSVEARQAELKDLEVFCDMVQQLSDIEYDKVQGSRNNDTTGDASTDCAGCNASSVIIHELNKEIAKLEEQLQKTASSGVLIAKLKDAEAAADRLLERNRFLEAQLTLPSSEGEINTSSTPQKEPHSATKPHRATNKVAESKTVTTKNDAAEENNVKKTHGKTDTIPQNKSTRAMIISSSMGRGLAREIHTHHRNNIDCFGLVHPSAKAEDLEKSAKDMLTTYKPDVVTLMGGTNNLACGERPRSVISKIEHLVRVCQQASPSTKVVVSGLIVRSDRPELNDHIKTINAVLKRNSYNKDFAFLDNSSIDFQHLKDGLHLNYNGKIKLARSIGQFISHHPFHNGHQKIHV